MPVFSLQRRVQAPANVVWKVMSDVGGLADVAPHVSRVEILGGHRVGLERRVFDRHGESWTEKCVAWVDGSHYTMEVDTSSYAFPYKSMKLTFRLVRDAGSVRVAVELDYQPKYGLLGTLIGRYRLNPRFKRVCKGLVDGWIKQAYQRGWVYQMTARTIVERRGSDIFSVTSDTSIGDTGKLLRKHTIGSAMVLANNGEIEGIVSERDIVRAIADNGPAILGNPVSDIMTPDVITCDVDDDMVTIMGLMTHKRIRHLPVLEDGKLFTVISIHDVVKLRMDELEHESANLREYIESRRWTEMARQYGPGAHEQRPVPPGSALRV